MRNVSRRAVLTVLFTLSLSGAVAAATPPATGLGQAWPNATDVSQSPNYHAYVFVLGGIRYIQINDVNGNVLGSVGTIGGQFITLPVGKFAQLVSTPQQSATLTGASATSAPTTVYSDGTTTVTATPLSDGTTSLTALLACDPVDCNVKSP